MSDYFDASGNRIADGLTARATDVNTLRDEVGTAFDLLPDVANLTTGTVSYAVDTGTANSYLVALPETPASYTDGLLVTMRPINSNSGASTINVNGLGVKSIRGIDGLAISAGDIVVGIPVDLRYSTATGYFHLAPNSAADATAAAASAAAASASASAASASESAAAGSASSASASASTATTKASEASASAAAALSSKNSAATSETNAAASVASAVAIYGSISAVNTAATNASNSASAAATSATNASTSATNAASSASAAATSATAASASASSASSSASAAASSYSSSVAIYGSLGAVQAAETAAAASASSASASATTATNQAAAAAASALSAASVVSQDLSAIDRTVFSATIVDTFLYDTSKDSDGGAWRKRCAHTSWENETLSGNWLGSAANETAARAISGATTGSYYYDTTAAGFYTLNAGSGKTATYRGNVRQFPAQVLITVEAARVVLWDLTQAGCPMWMVFATNGFINWPTGTPSMVSAAMLNGTLVMVGNNTFSGNVAVSFVKDDARTIYGAAYSITSSRRISARNATATYAAGGDCYVTVASVSNDVAMTVLPNAPVDVATGLPVPTIAVATAGGVSVIKDDGTVANSALTSSVKSVAFNKQNALFYGYASANGAVHANFYPEWLTTSFTSARYWGSLDLPNNASSNTPALVGAKSLAVGNSVTGLALLRVNHAKATQAVVADLKAFITKDYNSGWMPGDIRGAWLAGTVAETLTGTDMITGDSQTFTSGVGSWTGSSGATLAAVAGELQVTNGSANYGIASLALTTVAGKSYVVGADARVGTTSNVRLTATTAIGAANLAIANTSSGTAVPLMISFVASGTTTYIDLINQTNTLGHTSYFDNISCRLADVDRSVKAKGLQAFGSLTKAAVASGAQLMGYSGFSAANYLEQPYNSDLDFGTGDFCVMGWVLSSAGGPTYQTIASRTDPLLPTSTWLLLLTAGVPTVWVGNAAPGFSALIAGTATIADGVPHLLVFSRVSGVAYLTVDGTVVASGANTNNYTNTSAKLQFCSTTHATFNYTGYIGRLALWRYSATVPSAEQIKHIYETEKPMFAASANCCLAGTSNAITALAYDDETDLLHVGTSAGRSAFKGLVRVSSEATPVGAITALAAGAGVIVQGGATAVDVYVPAYTLREELLRDAEQMAKFGQNLIAHDFTATASQTTFTLPVGWEIVAVYQQGAIKRETTSWTRSFDGFKWSAVLGTGATVSDWISILAKRV